ncbi:MAG: glycosyltransferase family 39 protein [Thermoanaerobaculia bacterium]
MRETPAVFLKLWLLVVAIALSVQLGGYPLYDADEGRNAEVAREMAATNDYVLPRLDTLPYLDKPIVYFAAEAAAMEVLGPTETAARLPSLLFTLATAAVLWWFAKRWWSEEEAWTSAIIFLSMPLTMAFARTVIFDSAVMFFVVVATVAFYFGIEDDRRWSIVAWVAIAFGVLTKGPVAIILPLFVAVPYAFRRKRSRAVWPLLGIIAFAVVIAPWVWAVTRVIPDFLRYVFVTETAQRLTTGALKRTGPPWYFMPYVLGGALPWSILAFGAWKKEEETGEAPTATLKRFFLLLWILVPFVFFSISQSKRPPYILPVMPAIALLVARAWTLRLRAGMVRSAAATIGVIGVALIIAPLFLHRARMKPEVAIAAHDVVVPLGICFVIGAIVAFLLPRDRRLALAALSIPVIAIPLVANPVMRGIGEGRSTKTLVAQLRPRLTDNTRVVGVEAFAGSLAFYLRRPVVVLTPDAEELTSNYLVRHYGHFANEVPSTIRPLAALEAEIAACCDPRIFIVRNNDGVNRARLEQHGMRAIAEGSRFVAYERPRK